MSEKKRHGLVVALLEAICSWTHRESKSQPQAFVVVLDRDHSLSPTEAAYGELLQLFDRFLRSGRRAGNPHNGVMVADRGRYQRALESWVEVARARYPRPQQAKQQRLYALAETPFFVDSKSTRLVQLADLLAYSFYRAYTAGDWAWAESVVPTLIASNPCRLVHLTSDATCECPACGRRTPKRRA